MSFWYLQFSHKMNEIFLTLILWYLKSNYFRTFFGENWRHQLDISKSTDLYVLRTHDGYMPNSLQPKFIFQSQMEISLKFLKLLVFLCRNIGRLIENHGLRTHDEKLFADSSTRNTPNTLQSIQPICPKRPIIWDIF